MKQKKSKKWIAWVAIFVIVVLAVVDFIEPKAGLIVKMEPNGRAASSVSAGQDKTDGGDASEDDAESDDGVEVKEDRTYSREEVEISPAGDGNYYTYNNGSRVNYTGLCANSYGTWLVEDGKVNFGYNGTWTDPNTGYSYTVSNGQIMS